MQQPSPQIVVFWRPRRRQNDHLRGVDRIGVRDCFPYGIPYGKEAIAKVAFMTAANAAGSGCASISRPIKMGIPRRGEIIPADMIHAESPFLIGLWAYILLQRSVR